MSRPLSPHSSLSTPVTEPNNRPLTPPDSSSRSGSAAPIDSYSSIPSLNFPSASVSTSSSAQLPDEASSSPAFSSSSLRSAIPLSATAAAFSPAFSQNTPTTIYIPPADPADYAKALSVAKSSPFSSQEPLSPSSSQYLSPYSSEEGDDEDEDDDAIITLASVAGSTWGPPSSMSASARADPPKSSDGGPSKPLHPAPASPSISGIARGPGVIGIPGVNRGPRIHGSPSKHAPTLGQLEERSEDEFDTDIEDAIQTAHTLLNSLDPGPSGNNGTRSMVNPPSPNYSDLAEEASPFAVPQARSHVQPPIQPTQVQVGPHSSNYQSRETLQLSCSPPFSDTATHKSLTPAHSSPAAPPTPTVPAVPQASSTTHLLSAAKLARATSSEQFSMHGQDLHATQPQFAQLQSEVQEQGQRVNASFRTPNVYINGLPPHFPEDQLYALTSPYGVVKSVRSFTRHVGEKSSGYGFVLYDTVDGAEKCIEALRKYRNLHPSFSKQVHKIPGTSFTLAPSPVTQMSTLTSKSGFESEDAELGETYGYREPRFVGESSDSFKARMERYKDETSTNLYIEGLPLSIDEPTLAALVSPYSIKSSRFFQTKLSQPPRIIAFVRLESRSAAEEIIERLHGRMVRGWNDPGSRISVRFADTAEQRELRRTERAAREGESSPARLTMAQAALLNLRGQDVQVPAHIRRSPASVISEFGIESRGSPTEFSSNAQLSDYGLQASGLRAPFPYSQQRQQVGHGRSLNVDREMSAMLETLRSTGTPFTISEGYAQELEYHRRASRLQALQSARLGADLRLNMGAGVSYPNESVQPFSPASAPISLGQTQALSGFTPAEQIILQAHAGSQANRHGLDHRGGDTFVQRGLGIGMGNGGMGLAPRGKRPQSFVTPLQQHQQNTQQNPHHSTLLPIEPVNELSENEFHASPLQRSHQQMMQAAHHQAMQSEHVSPSLSHDVDDSRQSSQQQRQATQASNASQNQELFMHAHIRSTTHPHRSSSSRSGNRHYQHSSLSVPHSNNVITATSTSNSLRTPNPIQNQHFNSIDNNSNILDRNHYDDNHDIVSTIQNFKNRIDADKHSSNSNQAPNPTTHDYKVDSSSSPPALTYSPRTPGTLSPATPFFGSFGHAAQTFEGHRVGADRRKMRAGVP